MSCRVVDGIEDNEPAFHFNVESSEVTSNRRAKGKSLFFNSTGQNFSFVLHFEWIIQ